MLDFIKAVELTLEYKGQRGGGELVWLKAELVIERWLICPAQSKTGTAM